MKNDIAPQTLFLHIPKCAGSSMLHHSFIQKCKRLHPIDDSGVWHKIQEERLEKFFKFAFVRNPWSRMVSLYFYFYTMKPDHFAYKYDAPTVKKIQPFKSFEDFCINFTDFDHGKFHFLPQSKWTHHNNKSFVDFTGRIESLQSDLRKLEGLLNIDYCSIPLSNSSPHEGYTHYYNSKSIEAVAEIYKDDIINFNYEFQ